MPSMSRRRFPPSSRFDTTAGWHAFARAGRSLLPVAGVLLLIGCSSATKRAPALHRVIIRGFRFEPESLSIVAGDTVEWRNEDIVPHTSSALDSSWDSDTLQPGQSWRLVPAFRDSAPYHCRLHPTMQATLVIR